MDEVNSFQPTTAKDALASLPSPPLSSNRLLPGDEPVHDWYRFVLSFPPHLVRHYLTKFGLTPGSTVLDPFCGTGTTLVECAKLGISSVGVESNPVAAFASDVKTDWSLDSSGLVRHAEGIARRVMGSLRDAGIPDDRESPLFSAASMEPHGLRALPPQETKLLLRESISPLPLHKCLVLKDAIDRARTKDFTRHELLALAKTAVDCSNLRFGPEVGLGHRREDAPVVEHWLRAVRTMAVDLDGLGPLPQSECRIYEADARCMDELTDCPQVDAVFTSPPYPNEKDYTRTTRLESVLLGFVHSGAEMRAVKRRLVSSNTRCTHKSDDDDRYVEGVAEIDDIARRIEERRLALGKDSGFEKLYARVARLYFGGMARHLKSLQRLLKPGATLAYVVGDQASFLRVMIRTGQLLVLIAERLGYERIGIDLFRTRMATATKAQLREEVVLLRWPGRRTT